MSVNYNRVLRVETHKEASVLKCIEQNDGVYLPPDIVVRCHVFFAVDNVDFCEDTPDGKRTFHGTAMAIYQRPNAQDQVPDIAVDPKIQSRSIKYLPESITELLECQAPPSKPFMPVYREFHLFFRAGTSVTREDTRLHMASWTKFVKSFCRHNRGDQRACQ